MSQLKFRANLSAANVPYISDFQSRTIVIPQYDQNNPRIPQYAGSDSDKDIGIPQAMYIQNVLATGQGFQSIGYDNKIAGIGGGVTDFDQYFLLRDSAENKFLFSPAIGKSYIYRGDTMLWKAYNTLTPGTFAGVVTRAYIHGRTFICYEKINIYEFNKDTDTFAPAAGLTFIDVSQIRGICQAVNYTVAFTDTTVYWSNPLFGSELDFTPSTLTGAGNSQIQEVRGKIIAVLPISGGFMVYTTANVVKAQYSGNIRFPWVFSEVNGSAGVASPEHVAYESDFTFHYAWTTSGLMRIEKSGAELVYPEATDFLCGRIFEDYDPSTLLTVTYLTGPLYIKVSMAGSRYVIISYGIALGLFTHAIVFDIGLKRWGKLKVTHVDAFEFIQPNFFGVRSYAQLTPNTYAQLSPTTYAQLSTQQTTTAQPGKNIGFLQQDGTIVTVNMEVGNINANGVLFVGKFQLQRTKLLGLEEIDCENTLNTATNFNLVVLTSVDGKTFAQKKTAIQNYKAGVIRKFGCRAKGENHTLVFSGAFNLVYLGLTCVQEGNR